MSLGSIPSYNLKKKKTLLLKLEKVRGGSFMGPTHGENTIPQCGKVGSRAYTVGNFQSMKCLKRKKALIGKEEGGEWKLGDKGRT